MGVILEPFSGAKGLSRALDTQTKKSDAMPISPTMASTPRSGGLGDLLRAVNSGIGALGRRGGPVIDSDSSSDEEEVGDVASNFEDGVVANIGDHGTIGGDDSTNNTMVATRSNNSLADPAVDPPRVQRDEPTGAEEEAFEEGYDSDGWEGPPTSTDPAEYEEVEEDEVDNSSRPVVETVLEEPIHVPIADDTLARLTVKQITLELKKRNVGLPRSKKKANLLQRLKEALDKKTPVYPEDQQTDIRGDDDMADFSLGAKWIELEGDVDVDEPINQAFPGARAPTALR